MNNILIENPINLLRNITNNNIPGEVIEHINFFEQLDEEYKLNVNKNIVLNKMFFYNNIKNKNWRGIWYKPTGQDKKLYINWLYSGIKYDEYKTLSLEYWYKEAHLNEKYIPYAITLANQDLHKYFI